MRLRPTFPGTLLLAVGLLLAGTGCLSPDERPAVDPLPEGMEVHVEGRVTEIDVSAMSVDGDGLLSVETERYGTVRVRIPARERLCEAEGLETLHSLHSGDAVAARGRVTAGGDLEVCAAPSHFLATPETSASVAPTPDPVSADPREVEARERAFFESFVARDLEGVMAFFAEDALLQIAGMPPVEGRDAIRDFYGNLFRFMVVSSPEPERARVSSAGDLAYTVGRVVNRFEAEQGPQDYEGKYLLVWERRDGDWRVAVYNVGGND